MTDAAPAFRLPALRLPSVARPVLPVLLSLAIAGCGGTLVKRTHYEPEEFDSTTTHTRSYAAAEAQTCEAARRALLSQGYLITTATAEGVSGRKSFQPGAEVHVEVEFRVVCARDQVNGRHGTLAFASALQDRYGLKKVNNSASVGVGAIGSLSLPFNSSDDAMVKVASETLTDERFYDRFFALMDRYLETQQPPGAAAPGNAPAMPASVEGATASPVRVPPALPAAVPLPAPEAAPAPVPLSPSRG